MGKKGMTKRELIKEISDMTGLKTHYVKDVLNAFTYIGIREAVMNEHFHLANFFTIDSYEKGPQEGYNVHLKKKVTYPPTRVLNIKLSRKVNKFFRWKMRNLNNAKYGVTQENWMDILDEDGNIKEEFLDKED